MFAAAAPKVSSSVRLASCNAESSITGLTLTSKPASLPAASKSVLSCAVASAKVVPSAAIPFVQTLYLAEGVGCLLRVGRQIICRVLADELLIFTRQGALLPQIGEFFFARLNLLKGA